MMRTTALTLLALLLCVPAFADVLVLKSGEKIECRILSEGKMSVRIKDRNNKTRSIRNEDIENIERGKTSWDRFDEGWKKVDKKNIDALLDLALLAHENDLSKRLKKVLPAIFKLDKDNEKGREYGDFVREGDRWITRSELRQREEKKRLARLPNLRAGREDKTIAGQRVVWDIPSGYHKGKKWPVLFVFHGNGDTAGNFLNWYLGGAKGKGYILIAFEENDINKNPFAGVMDELKTLINYDPERLYTFGFSGGSYTAAYLPFKYKDTFAAAAFGGGGLPTDDVPQAGKNPHGNFIWCGRSDVNHFPVAEKAQKILKKRGYEVVWKPYAGGHTDVPGGLVKEVFAFFAKHRLKKE